MTMKRVIHLCLPMAAAGRELYHSSSLRCAQRQCEHHSYACQCQSETADSFLLDKQT